MTEHQTNDNFVTRFAKSWQVWVPHMLVLAMLVTVAKTGSDVHTFVLESVKDSQASRERIVQLLQENNKQVDHEASGMTLCSCSSEECDCGTPQKADVSEGKALDDPKKINPVDGYLYRTHPFGRNNLMTTVNTEIGKKSSLGSTITVNESYQHGLSGAIQCEVTLAPGPDEFAQVHMDLHKQGRPVDLSGFEGIEWCYEIDQPLESCLFFSQLVGDDEEGASTKNGVPIPAQIYGHDPCRSLTEFKGLSPARIVDNKLMINRVRRVMMRFTNESDKPVRFNVLIYSVRLTQDKKSEIPGVQTIGSFFRGTDDVDEKTDADANVDTNYGLKFGRGSSKAEESVEINGG